MALVSSGNHLKRLDEILEFTKSKFTNDLVPDTVLAEIDKTEDEVIAKLATGELKVGSAEEGHKLKEDDILTSKVIFKK